MINRSLITLLLFSFSLSGWSQNEKLVVNGYIKSMQTIYAPETDLIGNDILSDNLLHNRINIRHYTTDHLTMALEIRNRFMYGEIVKLYPDYGAMLEEDPGFFDLSKTISSGAGYALHTMIDRVYVDYTNGNFQARIGRQRINWGINLVWNPNDVFNTFNYFDFDYEERPGTDAVRLQYYTGAASSTEIVYQPGDSLQSSSFAAMYRINKWQYDYQLMGGYIKDDLVVGFGWSGNISNAGFRGEVTYFKNQQADTATSGQWVASVSLDYMFSNSFYLHAGILYNSNGTTGKATQQNILLQNEELSVKKLTPARSSLFTQASYPITPLLNADLSWITNPHDRSFYVSPTLSYSLTENLDTMIVGQIFSGNEGTEYGDIGQLFFLRIKYSY